MSKPSQDNFVTLSPNHLTRVVPLISIRASWEGWSSYKLTWGERRVTPWTGCQTIAKVSLNCKLAVYIIDRWVNFHKYNLYSSPSALLGFRWESGVQKVPLSGIGCLRFLTHIPVCTCTHQPLLPTLQTFTLCLVLMHLFPRALTLHSTFLHFVCSAICLKTEIWITWYMYISTVISQMKISGNSKHRFFFFFRTGGSLFILVCVCHPGGVVYFVCSHNLCLCFVFVFFLNSLQEIS